MAIKKIGKVTNNSINEYIGLTADSKPTDCGAGSTFLELDGEKRCFIFDGTAWYEL